MRTLLLLLFLASYLFAQVNLNNATSSELLELNGIGKAKAQKIINYRKQHGCFRGIEELERVDGISKNILNSNRRILILGSCQIAKKNKKTFATSLKEVLLDPINLIFVIIILTLGFLDQKTGKDLKGQIVSVGVLGTFVGIFIGLQSFNPDDITNSVNDILIGLKTAFFTSIMGMSVSTILSVYQTFQGKKEDE